jgi:hypothetical protein
MCGGVGALCSKFGPCVHIQVKEPAFVISRRILGLEGDRMDVASISAAAIGVKVGVVFAALELRNATRQRRTEFLMNTYCTHASTTTN